MKYPRRLSIYKYDDSGQDHFDRDVSITYGMMRKALIEEALLQE